jgi:hypothetical protein
VTGTPVKKYQYNTNSTDSTDSTDNF